VLEQGRRRALGEFDPKGGLAPARIAEEERDSKDCVPEKEGPLKERIETDDRQKAKNAVIGAAEKRILQNEEQTRHQSVWRAKLKSPAFRHGRAVPLSAACRAKEASLR
jgi:hypothetical protein